MKLNLNLLAVLLVVVLCTAVQKRDLIEDLSSTS